MLSPCEPQCDARVAAQAGRGRELSPGGNAARGCWQQSAHEGAGRIRPLYYSEDNPSLESSAIGVECYHPREYCMRDGDSKANTPDYHHLCGEFQQGVVLYWEFDTDGDSIPVFFTTSQLINLRINIFDRFLL